MKGGEDEWDWGARCEICKKKNRKLKSKKYINVMKLMDKYLSYKHVSEDAHVSLRILSALVMAAQMAAGHTVLTAVALCLAHGPEPFWT